MLSILPADSADSGTHIHNFSRSWMISSSPTERLCLCSAPRRLEGHTVTTICHMPGNSGRAFRVGPAEGFVNSSEPGPAFSEGSVWLRVPQIAFRYSVQIECCPSPRVGWVRWVGL